jgi:hypothetical protein
MTWRDYVIGRSKPWQHEAWVRLVAVALGCFRSIQSDNAQVRGGGDLCRVHLLPCSDLPCPLVALLCVPLREDENSI